MCHGTRFPQRFDSWSARDAVSPRQQPVLLPRTGTAALVVINKGGVVKYLLGMLVIAFNTMLICGCISDSGSSSTDEQSSFVLTNAQVSSHGDAFIIKGLSDGVEVSVTATDIGVEDYVASLGIKRSPLEQNSSTQCFICACKDGECLCVEILCP